MTFKPWIPVALCLAVAGGGGDRRSRRTAWRRIPTGASSSRTTRRNATSSRRRRARSPSATASPTEVQRGDVRLFVSFRPAEKVTNEVSFTGGYPFKPGSSVDAGGRLGQVHPGARAGRRRRVGLDRPLRRQPGGGGAAQGLVGEAHRHLVARHLDRGHLLALGLHRRRRGRRRPLPLSRPRARGLAFSARRGYLNRSRAGLARPPSHIRAMTAAVPITPDVLALPRRPASRTRCRTSSACPARRCARRWSRPARRPSRPGCGSRRSGSGSTTAARATSRRCRTSPGPTASSSPPPSASSGPRSSCARSRPTARASTCSASTAGTRSRPSTSPRPTAARSASRARSAARSPAPSATPAPSGWCAT